MELETAEAASAAIQRFDGYELGGRQLRVNEAAERSPRAAPFGSARAFGAPAPGRRHKPKGSRRNLRGRKRSIW